MDTTWSLDCTLPSQCKDGQKTTLTDEARALYNIGAQGPRSKHGLVFRSPVINVSRDPRWGRIQEVFSEDPYLTGRTGVAYIQGDDPHYLKVAATTV